MFSDSFSSQPLSMGFGSQSPPKTSPQTPQKKSRTEDRLSCLPVTSKTILTSASEAQGEELRIHGQDVTMVLLVGVVEALVQQAASVDFVLNDSTGRLKVRQYFTESSPTSRKLLPGQYVAVAGSVRAAPELHVSAQSVTCVESPDEVSYHMIEATHAALKLRTSQRRPVATPQALATPVKTATFAVPAAAPAAALSATPECEKDVAMPSASGEEVLRSSVMATLQRAAGDPSGVKLSAIVQALAPASESDVKACLAALVDAGEIFNTLDDEHFSSL